MTNWPTVPLGELCDRSRSITYGIVKVGDFVPGGVPVIRGGDIRNNKIVFDDEKRVTQEVSDAFSRTILRGGEILINLIAEPGHSAIVPPEMTGFNISRDVAVIPLGDSVSHSFVNWYLMSPAAIEWLTARLSGSVTQKINLGVLRELPVPLPERSCQERLAAVLGAIDDKITVNDRIAVVTEDLLRNTYLAYGTAGTGIRVGDIGHVVRESVNPDSLRGNEPYIGLEHMPRKQVWLSSWGSSSAIGSTKSAFKAGDILFGKLRPYFHKVGIALVGGVCSTDIIVVQATKPEYRSWLLMALSSDEVVAHATARSDGTRMPRAKWSDLADFKVPWPGTEQVARFEESAAVLIQRAESAVAENHALVRLLDALLPRLMSGKLRVRDAEKIVEDAV